MKVRAIMRRSLNTKEKSIHCTFRHLPESAGRKLLSISETNDMGFDNIMGVVQGISINTLYRYNYEKKYLTAIKSYLFMAFYNYKRKLKLKLLYLKFTTQFK